jgi:hypothetical protein
MGALVIMSQCYSMIYRYTITQSDIRIHKMFISKWSKIGNLFFHQIIGIFIGTLAYFSYIKQDVSDFTCINLIFTGISKSSPI